MRGFRLPALGAGPAERDSKLPNSPGASMAHFARPSRKPPAPIAASMQAG